MASVYAQDETSAETGNQRQEPEPEAAPTEEAEAVPTEATEAAPAEATEVTPTEAGARESVTLDTIEVTASKRIKTQRDIPGSVGAIRGEHLERMGAQSMKDFLKLVPGVLLQEGQPDESTVIIRGISAETSFSNTPLTTGLYIDDMAYNDLFVPLSLPDLNPFDLERVEVLKGPQGTLFGSGALAGAVRYILEKPKFGVWEGKLSETVTDTKYGGGPSSVTAAAVNVPLFGDSAALRFVGLFRETSGLYDSAQSGTENTDALEQETGRVLASWNPTEDLKLSGLYFLQNSQYDDFGRADNLESLENNYSPFPSPRDHDLSGANVVVGYDLGWAQLVSSTQRIRKHNWIQQGEPQIEFELSDQDDLQAYNLANGDITGYVEEVRLSSPEGGDDIKFEWLIGAAYQEYENFIWDWVRVGEPRPGPKDRSEISQADRDGALLYAEIDSPAKETALFGEASYWLTDYWELTAGARAFKTELSSDTLAQGLLIVALTQEPTFRQHFDLTEEGINPKVSLRYLHSRNVQFYGLAAKGFQFGGIQLNPGTPLLRTSAEEAGLPFDAYRSSDLWNYEAGMRTEWLDRTVRFDVGFFFLDWKDLQLAVEVPIGGTNSTFSVVTNVGRAHSEGAEALLEVIPFTGLKWTSVAAWISAVTDVPFDEDHPDGPVPAGARLPGTPHFQWSNVLSYERGVPYFPNWSFSPIVTHTHVGVAPDHIRPTGEVGGYDTLDARLSLVKTDSRFLPEVAVGVYNLTDVRAVSSHSVITDQSGDEHQSYHFIQPLTALVSLSMRY